MDTSEKLLQLAAALHDVAAQMSATACRLLALVQVLDERNVVPFDVVKERAALLHEQAAEDLALRAARVERRIELGPLFERPLHGEPPTENPPRWAR
jgi:hypothetical protein